MSETRETGGTTEGAVAVLVRLTVQAEREEDFKVELQKVLNQVRQEPACLYIHGHQSEDDPTQYMLYELWRSYEEFKEFDSGREYLREYMERVRPWWTRPRDLSFWGQVA